MSRGVRLALVLAGVLALAGGCSSPAPRGEYRQVLLDGHPAVCAAVYRSEAQHERGLSGPHAPVAGAFVNQPPLQPSLWMRDVRHDLVGVWVGPAGRILGSVRMRAMTTVLHPAPAPVQLVLELPPTTWARWSGATTAALGRTCRP